MSEPQAGPGRPRRLRPYPWVVAAWSDRLVHAVVAGVVIGIVTWRVGLAANAVGSKAAATGAVVGLLMAVVYGSLVLAGRRSRDLHEEHPWASVLTLPVPLAILLPTLHYLRGEASLARTLLSAAVLLVLGSVVWRLLNPHR
jgi:hypothetical protein